MAISAMNAQRLDIIANTTPKAFAVVSVSQDIGENCGNQTLRSNHSNVNVSKGSGTAFAVSNRNEMFYFFSNSV